MLKKVKIICKQKVFKNHIREEHDDEGLKVLNGYLESKWIDINEDENIDDVVQDFLKLHPKFQYEDAKIFFEE
ncbi:MAG: hypothetical protein K6G88_13760 [Lachnospiraceae bacterium]|nr:hypothetical protein [Lachnospiraceae bacterium]